MFDCLIEDLKKIKDEMELRTALLEFKKRVDSEDSLESRFEMVKYTTTKGTYFMYEHNREIVSANSSVMLFDYFKRSSMSKTTLFEHVLVNLLTQLSDKSSIIVDVFDLD